MLTKHQIQDYNKNGFIVIEELLTKDEINKTRGLIDQFIEESREINESDSIFDLEDTNIILRLISGSASGCMGWLAIYPLDTIRSRILSLPRPLSDPSINGRTLASTIYRTEGIRGFYKGILPCLLRAAPVAAFVLPTYDYVLDYFRTKE